jgi:hypothetical protein
VIALGIYVLFRAMQLFFGGVSQDSAATVSTSVFLLAALGLASGFALASRLLRSKLRQREYCIAESGRDRDETGPRRSILEPDQPRYHNPHNEDK